MPKISVILPVYNVEQYIAKSIHSVLNQSYIDFELIVVIDGSKDNSEVIAREFEKTDLRVKVYTKPNGGLSDARNYGLNVATGEFIYFLDSDDWIEPNLLEDNIKMLEDKNLDFIVFGFYQDNVDSNEQLIENIPHIPENNEWINGEPIYFTPYMLNILGYAWNKIYRKGYLDKHQIKFTIGVSLVEDILFNAKVYQYADRIVFNRQAYVHYIQRPVTTLTKQFHEKSFEWVKLKHTALQDFLNAWSFDNKQEILASNLIGGLRYCVLNLCRYKNHFNFNQKIKYIENMLNDKDLANYAQFYNPKTKNDKIYYQLIKMRAKYPIAALAQIRG
nr:glycosyltransferase family 2 protein [Moraxella sp. CTOTU49097]